MGVSPAVGAVSAGVDVDDDVAGVDVDAVDAVDVAAAAGETPAYHTVESVAEKTGSSQWCDEPVFMLCNRKQRLQMVQRFLLAFFRDGSLLCNAGFLTCKLAQVVELSAANLTNLVHLDALNVGRL